MKNGIVYLAQYFVSLFMFGLISKSKKPEFKENLGLIFPVFRLQTFVAYL